MTAIAYFAPEGRELDLSALSHADYDLVKGLHGQIKHGDAVLLCGRTAGDREMFIFRSSAGAYYARHFSGGGHGDHKIARMTDEHLRGRDTWLTGWEQAGLSTGTEVTTDNNVRLDAVAFGEHVTGLEVQVQDQDARTVKGRDTRRRRARSITGQHARELTEPLRVVWFAPVGRPKWLYAVPTIECRNRSWELTPDPQTVAAIGVQAVDVKPCNTTWFSRCPYQGRSWCGKVHLWREPRPGLSIADVAAMVPAGDLVPVQFPAGVYLTDRIGYARSKSFGYARPAPEPIAPRAGRSRNCNWEGHFSVAETAENSAIVRGSLTHVGAVAPGPRSPWPLSPPPRPVVVPGICDTPACGAPARPYAHGLRCDAHKPQGRPWLMPAAQEGFGGQR